MMSLFSYFMVPIVAGLVWCPGPPPTRGPAVVAAKVCGATRPWQSYVIGLLHWAQTKAGYRYLVIVVDLRRKLGL